MPLSAAQRRLGRAQTRHKALICCRCGASFTAVRKTALYCSATCRQPPSPLSAGKADKLVRHYFRRFRPQPENLPDTLEELLSAIGLTAKDAALLSKTYGRYYFEARYAQAWPKAHPSGQTSPAAASTWNNLSRAMKGSLNLGRIKVK